MTEVLAPWPEDQRQALELFGRALAGESFSITGAFGASAQQEQVYDLRFNPIRDAQGRTIGAAHIVRNVTEQVRVERALRESEDRFRMLAENISQLAWMADAEGAIGWYNARWFEFTGTTLAEMQGWGWTKVHHPDHLERVLRDWRACHVSGELYDGTFPLRGADGRYRWFLSRAVPVRDEAGRVVGWMGTNTDVTELRDAEERLRESDRRKDEYLAMLGHELRNPLAAVRNATALVKLSQGGDPRLQRAADVLERQSAHMSQLIDDLLDVARIARGKIELTRVPLDLREVLDGVLQSRMAQLAQRGLRLERDAPDEPLWVQGDPVRLAQVFDNLLGNAIEFTASPGVIEVALRRDDQRAVVRVRDTGVGLEPGVLARIFEPFEQERQDISRTEGGIGLGLALVRGLVELHGGSVEARSAGRGRGAEFEVRLPLGAPPTAAERGDREEPTPARRILLVEDNEDAAETLRELLELRGHQVSVAQDGVQALEALRARATDVVLCDIGLPGMSGYEVAQGVRADPDLRHVLLVALTGYGQPEDRRRAKEAGFDEHLTKPVAPQVIEQVIALGR